MSVLFRRATMEERLKQKDGLGERGILFLWLNTITPYRCRLLPTFLA